MKCLMFFCAGLFSTAVFATPTVSDVVVRQIQPWNGLVEITVMFSCESNDLAELVWTFVATNSATQKALPMSHVRQVGRDTGTGLEWQRHFIWDVAADLGEVKIDDVVLVVEAQGPVQLWENGPYWAPCNVGATKPEEYGYYFWWGDTVGCKRNANDSGWISVKDSTGFSFSSDNCPTYGKSYTQLQSEGYIDATGNLVAAHDAATAHLGAPWRMPTDSEFSALVNNCTTTWTTRNGVTGRLVTGKGLYASKSIFLPAAGHGYKSYIYYLGSYGLYWSSMPNSDKSDYAWNLYFFSGLFYWDRYSDRYDGQTVRPVRGFAK